MFVFAKVCKVLVVYNIITSMVASEPVRGISVLRTVVCVTLNYCVSVTSTN